MTLSQRLKSLLQQQLEHFRLRLAYTDALPQLVVLGLIAGIATGLLIVLFRLAISLPLVAMLGGDSENFESLARWQQFALPVIGALILGLVFHRIDRSAHRVGVSHVIERTLQHQARLPLKNMLVQFFGGAFALICGFSAGREGPAVHLGAANSSLLGQSLKLPNNSLRILVGSGSAAAIAASFNTPIAGVIFAMEVILGDYTIVSFIPIIIAAVSATIISILAFGSDPLLSVPTVSGYSLSELTYIIVGGVIIGGLAALFIQLQKIFLGFSHYSVLKRFLLAGLITGSIAIFIPEIMGIGYDTINAAVAGKLALTLLVPLIFAKILATAAAVGLGIPAGLIGANMVSGACIGACLGIVASYLFPNTADVSFYIMLGMAAMVGAVINAPLATLLAVMEMTYNPHIILPAMLMIVAANLTCQVVFKQRSAFETTMSFRDKQQHLLAHILQRAGVTSIMQTDFVLNSRFIEVPQAQQLVEQKPLWIVISDVGEQKSLLNPADLSRFLDTHSAQLLTESKEIDLLEIPATRMDMVAIHRQANLSEALELLQQSGTTALYVQQQGTPLLGDVAGIITESDLRNYYAPASRTES